MSEVLTKEYYGMPGWGWVAVGGGVVIGGVFLAYEYFIAPANVILDQYRLILEDIYRETKQFLEENEAEGIYGLTTGQEAILSAKERSADYLRPQVEKIIFDRGEQVWSWVETAIIGILLIYGIKEVVPELVNALKKWRAERPEASAKTASQYGHGHLIFEMVANEYALAGKLNVASAFYNASIPSIYSNFTEPALNAQIIYYNALLPKLPPGTLDFLVAQQMLTYLSFEASSATGLLAVLHTFWLPPLI